MPLASIDALDLHYETHGLAGTPVLLIMGYTMPGRAWRFQVPALAARHRVCTFDNRGAGATTAPPPPYAMARLAADAALLLDHLGWADAHVVGVSMGGMVAQHLALDHRPRVRSLTLVATSAGGFWSRLPRPAGALHFLRGTFGPRSGRLDATARLLFPPSFRASADPAWLREVLRHDFGTPPTPAGRKGQLRAVFGHDTRRRLGALAGLPTLVIQPERDILVRPRESLKLHALIPGSRLLPIPDAGHGLLRQAAEPINAALLDHFAAADTALARKHSHAPEFG